MNLIVRNHSEMLQALCRAEKRPGMYLRFDFPDAADDPVGETLKAVPYLDEKRHAQLFHDGFGFVFFDTVEDMRACFDRTRGPEGPARDNPYRGPARVYAVACDADGAILGDNTASGAEG